MCICCVSLSLALSLLCTSTISPRYSYIRLPSISRPLLLCVFTAAPLPQYRHPSCIFLCFCCARVFSQQLLHTFMNTILCLPLSACPLLLLQFPFVHPLALLIFILFFFPSFDIPVSSLSLSAPPFSQSPLYCFSSNSL